MTIKLGDLCRDRVSGFEGIVVVRSDYISGCSRIGLQPKIGADGKLPDALHFDEPMCEVVKAAAVKSLPTNDGGPRTSPSHHASPERR